MYKKSILILSIAIISVFFALIGWSVYRYYALLSVDNAQEPTVFVSSGTVTLVRGEVAFDMQSSESLTIEAHDRIISGKHSFSRIVWPDGSLTRIGSSTEIRIQELNVSKDLTLSQIRIDLEKGKIWTNIIRAFFGDSYFETRIPSDGVVAAVRGTVYEINLDDNYIHTVNHAIQLTHTSGKSISLLSGEIVKANNIFERLTSQILDSSWNLLNTYADGEFIKKRSEQIQKQITTLSEVNSIWDRFIRYILSYFSFFDRIEVAEILDTGTEGFDALSSKVSTASLLRWYQDVANIDFSSELRQSLREKILRVASPEEKKKIEPTLIYGAIWDRFTTTSANISPVLDSFIDNLSKEMPSDMKDIYNSLYTGGAIQDRLKGDIDTLQQVIKNTIRSK